MDCEHRTSASCALLPSHEERSKCLENLVYFVEIHVVGTSIAASQPEKAFSQERQNTSQPYFTQLLEHETW